MGGIAVIFVMIAMLAILFVIVAVVAILLALGITGIVGGLAILFTGRALDKNNQKKTISKVSTVIAIIFLVLGIATSGYVINFIIDVINM